MVGRPGAGTEAGAPLRVQHLGRAFLGAVTVTTLGMAATIAGTIVGPLFLPGVFLIGIGLLALGVAGIVAMVQTPAVEPASETPARRSASAPHT